jgi:hypothetical protein
MPLKEIGSMLSSNMLAEYGKSILGMVLLTWGGVCYGL